MGDATQLYIPIVTVVGMVSMLSTVIWFAATVSTKVSLQGERIKELEKQVKDMPSREEFDALKNTINRMEVKLDMALAK